jgi:hypothetical protein
LIDLCSSFPREVSSALLAYAQAASFTKYLQSAYGTSSIQALLEAYANGMSCDRGAQAALGSSLNQLDRQWQRDALAENIALDALGKLTPWLLILASVLAVPLILTLRRR